MEGLFSDDQEKHVAFAKTRKRDWQCVWGEVDEGVREIGRASCRERVSSPV